MENLTQSPSASPVATYTTYLDIVLKYYGISEHQALSIIIAHKVSSSLSMLGSAYVLQDIFRDPQKRNGSIYHRTMLGVSGSDFILALAVFIGTWAMPKGEHIFSIGNDVSCDIVGFFNSFLWTLSPMYNCSLATYYLLQLKYNWVERKMKAVGKWLHIVPWVLSIGRPIAALLIDAMGPFGFTCGTSNNSILLYTGMGLYFGAILYVIVVMFLVYKYVRDIEVKAAKYTFTAYSQSQAADRRRSRRIMIQGVMYAVALMLTFLPFMITIFIPTYITVILTVVISPLLGLFNAFIYSGVLQKWFYNNDGYCRYCSFSDFSMLTRIETLVSSMRVSLWPSKNSDGQKEEEEKEKLSSSSLTESKTSSKHNMSMTSGKSVLNSHGNKVQSSKCIDDVVEEEKEELTSHIPVHIDPQTPSKDHSSDNDIGTCEP